MFDQALECARELDEYFSKHKATKGPLHGLPISLKDQFHVKDTDTTMGYVGWIGTYEGEKDLSKVHKVESQIVKELLSLGAVLYCKVVPLRRSDVIATAESIASD
jgi:amidase